MARDELRAGHAHHAFEAHIVPGHRVLDKERLSLDALNVRADTLTGERQHVALWGMLQQAHADTGLQRGQAATDSGLCDMQMLGCGCQGAVPGNC